MRASSFQTDVLAPEGHWQPRLRLGERLRSMLDFMRGYEKPILGDAHIIDNYLVGERLRSGERFAELFRWTFIILFLLLNIMQPTGGRSGQIVVDMVLAVWATANLAVTTLLFRGYQPNRWFCYATSGMDILLASALIGSSGGLGSPFYLAFFLAIISSSIRFGLLATAFTSTVISFLYFFVGGYATVMSESHASTEEVLGRIFIFMVVGVITGLMSQELIRERQLAIGRAAERDALQDMNNEMTATINLEEILGVVLKQALHIVGERDGRIFLVPADGGEVRSRDIDGNEVLVFDNYNLNEEKVKPRLIEKGTRMIVPIVAPHSDDLLLLDLRSKRAFNQRQFDMVSQLAKNAAGPVNNSLRYLSKEAEATTDSLTGLVNQKEMRRLIGVMIKRHKEGQVNPFSVMMIDLDHFKQINDTQGHEYGNEVLKKAARLIGKTMRSHDVVVRYGGDEMAVILSGAGLVEADLAARRMVEAVHAAAIKGTPDKDLTFSVGVATYPDHADTVETLLEAADQGLYLVKKAGRNGANRLRTRSERASESGAAS